MNILIVYQNVGFVVLKGEMDTIHFRDNTVIVEWATPEHELHFSDDAHKVDTVELHNNAVVITNMTKVENYVLQETFE